MAAKTTLSLEEFLKLPEGSYSELYKGELIPLSPGGTIHSILVARITGYLLQVLDDRFTVLSGEPGIIFEYDHNCVSVRGADVAVIPSSAAPYPEGMQRSPFLLAVEVISRSNDATYVEDKRHEYLVNGVQEVWLVYPKTETIHVYRGAGSAANIYHRGESFVSLGAEICTERFFSR